ncbi:MAG: acyloxyacyl hydrolase [Acidobacteriota bacterium]
MINRWSVFAAALLVCVATGASAQPAVAEDTRTQYPPFLSGSYFTFDVGRIGYVFSGDQLEPGFRAETVDVPNLAVRVDLFGHHFTRQLSVQATYMRPARFVAYRNINGNQETSQVQTAYAGLTLVWEFPLTTRVSAYGEAGGGVTSRSGFEIDGATALESAHYAAGLLGAGLAYHATPKIDVMFGATYSPGRKSLSQPSTRLYTSGIRFHMRPLPASTVENNRRAGFAFPRSVVRLGYTANLLGYGVNTFFSRKVPIFWGGNVETRRGFTVDYQRNVFHTRKVFAFDLGASASYWTSNGNREIFRTLSVYPLFRFFLARTEPADVYFGYSLAGPTFISRTMIDARNTGERFTFQDFIGAGAFFGKSRRMNAELGIKHYSNGNIFTSNASIKIPLTLTVGLAF